MISFLSSESCPPPDFLGDPFVSSNPIFFDLWTVFFSLHEGVSLYQTLPFPFGLVCFLFNPYRPWCMDVLRLSPFLLAHPLDSLWILPPLLRAIIFFWPTMHSISTWSFLCDPLCRFLSFWTSTSPSHLVQVAKAKALNPLMVSREKYHLDPPDWRRAFPLSIPPSSLGLSIRRK